LGNIERNVTLFLVKIEHFAFINVSMILHLGKRRMIKTITIGTYISVQGTFVRALNNGKIAVQVGQRIFEGNPVVSKAA